MKLLFILMTTFSVYLSAGAQEYDQEKITESTFVQTSAENREIMERAKSHNYRGGAEEGELRVQAQLPKSQRKIIPVVDKNDTESESQDHD